MVLKDCSKYEYQFEKYDVKDVSFSALQNDRSALKKTEVGVGGGGGGRNNRKTGIIFVERNILSKEILSSCLC